MSVRFNDQLLLWGLGVLQPASAEEVLDFLRSVLSLSGPLPKIDEIQPTIDRWVQGGQIVRVHAKLKLYSVGAKGNHLMPVALRRSRDKARIFLLKEAYAAKVSLSGDGSKRLAGDSPAMDSSSGTQGARPISPADVPLRAAPKSALNVGRPYWPRVVKQLNVGSNGPSPDTPFPFYSFYSKNSLSQASDRPAGDDDLSFTDLALAIGVSPRLLTSFVHKPTNHYRKFEIQKKGGGIRVINSPRIFLKIVQYWIVDYLLWKLPQHPCSHAYQIGKSIVSNASQHVGKKYVANVDIDNFFPSIGTNSLARVLKQQGLGEQISSVVARLASLNGGLPQGAPTSPKLSNAYMKDVDEEMHKTSTSLRLNYSRYADDITFSGNNRKSIATAIVTLRQKLAAKGLRLNEEKTRIASRGGQQKVTGVVVNKKPQPPRKLRRQIRAMIHQLAYDPTFQRHTMGQLRGYVSYLNSFPTLRDGDEISRYRKILKKFALPGK